MARIRSLTIAAALALSPLASAQVFLTEVLINPPGSFDDTREFVELTGTPNRKLDGYAVVFVFGMQEKLIQQGIMPPVFADEPEIDEFLPLDGLTLGANGILVLGIGDAAQYPLLPDTAFVRWDTLWSGPLDVSGKLQNDGSITVLLVRRRPGMTPTNLFDPKGPIWVKDSSVDREIVFGVFDPLTGLIKDQVGDGSFDQGGFNVLGAPMLDFRGKLTLADLTDDLEVVDEVSYEHDRGWEYDLDERQVDVGSPHPGLEPRRVHTLGDPQGINPDALSRVDYRTKGPGWFPTAGAVGQLPGGKNWQDTATEQWIRGETLQSGSGVGSFPFFYYDHSPNPDPSAIQPFMTNVPLWLTDGLATEYSFTPSAYQVIAGHVNKFATQFVPGDADRDGDCDVADLAKICSVFGEPDWIFSNSFAAAPEGDSGNPATQIRPWDVDGSGDHGIEPSDLQWALNFQGSPNGKIRGVSYDATGPSPTGVPLGPQANVIATVTADIAIPCGAPSTALRINDVVEITVRAQVTSGANPVAGEENGVMQFVHDLQFTSSNVVKVVGVEVIGPFQETAPGLLELPNSGNDGARKIHGFTTAFTHGIAAPVALHRITLRAIGPGTVSAFLSQATDPNLIGGTPHGVKLGHTTANGDPAAASYPGALKFTVTNAVGGLIAEYGQGCAGTGGFVPRLEGSGCATPSGTLGLEISQGKPGAVPLLFIGLNNLAGNLNPNCALQNLPILPTPLVLPALPGTTPGTGTIAIPGIVVPPSVPLGASAYLQTLFADAGGLGGVSATNPLRITFGL